MKKTLVLTEPQGIPGEPCTCLLESDSMICPRHGPVTPRELDAIVDVVLNYRPKNKARKVKRKRSAKKPAKGAA